MAVPTPWRSSDESRPRPPVEVHRRPPAVPPLRWLVLRDPPVLSGLLERRVQDRLGNFVSVHGSTPKARQMASSFSTTSGWISSGRINRGDLVVAGIGQTVQVQAASSSGGRISVRALVTFKNRCSASGSSRYRRRELVVPVGEHVLDVRIGSIGTHQRLDEAGERIRVDKVALDLVAPPPKPLQGPVPVISVAGSPAARRRPGSSSPGRFSRTSCRAS